MKNKLPALTAVALLAAGAAFGYRSYQRPGETNASQRTAATNPASSPVTSTAGDQLLVQARLALERRVSVTARIRYQAALAGRSLAGFGGYWQQGRGDDMHMRFELRVNSEDTSLLQVSNGRFLWTDQRLPAGRNISRLDLRKVRSESQRSEDDLDDFAMGRVRLAPAEPDLSIRTGGLPTLLMVLSDCFAFLPPQSMRWTPAQRLEGMSESIPVFATVGSWKPEILPLFVPEGKGIEALPQRLPQEVLILFGQTDLFPYRIEFRKRVPPPAKDDAAGVAVFQLAGDPLMLLELSAVSFDSQVPAGQFDYSAGDSSWDDRTAEYIDALRQQRADRTARRESALQR